MKLKALVITLAASVMLLGCGTAVAATAENDATPAFSMEFVDKYSDIATSIFTKTWKLVSSTLSTKNIVMAGIPGLAWFHGTMPTARCMWRTDHGSEKRPNHRDSGRQKRVSAEQLRVESCCTVREYRCWLVDQIAFVATPCNGGPGLAQSSSRTRGEAAA